MDQIHHLNQQGIVVHFYPMYKYILSVLTKQYSVILYQFKESSASACTMGKCKLGDDVQLHS